MEWYRLGSIHVSLNVIGGVTISTVLLSKRCADDNDSYETCVFQPDGDSNVIGCYSTEEEAIDRKSTRLNSSHSQQSRMPSSA